MKLNTWMFKDDVSAVDVSANGYVVVAGDDKTVCIYNSNDLKSSEPSHRFKTATIPTLVKFWIDHDSDKLIIVENGTTLHIYNWRFGRWMHTIYPKPFTTSLKPFIKDVFVRSTELVVVEDTGLMKTYELDSLKGGAGYTFPSSQTQQLNGWLYQNKYISSNSHGSLSKQFIGALTPDRCLFYRMPQNKENIETSQFKIRAGPSIVSSSCGSINQDGIAAVAFGSRLIIARPFDSYESA